MKIIQVQPPKDTKYTVEISYEELMVIRDSVLKQGRYYCGVEEKGIEPSAPWNSIVKEINRIIEV